MHLADAYATIGEKEGKGWKLLLFACFLMGLGPYFFVVLVPAFFLIYIPLNHVFDNSGSVGYWWFYAIVAAVVVRSVKWKLVAAILPALYGVIVGLTPQIIFLSLYNLKPLHETNYLQKLGEFILSYDLVLLRLRALIEPIEPYLIILLIALITASLLASIATRHPTIRPGLVAFAALKYAFYLLFIASAFAMSTSFEGGAWTPDVHSRLKAEQETILRETTVLRLVSTVEDELRTRDPETLNRYYLLANAIAHEREELERRDINVRRSLRAGVQGLANGIDPLIEDVPASSKEQTIKEVGPSELISTYSAERVRARAVETQAEAAKEALNMALIEIFSPGSLVGSIPLPRVLHEYLKEAVEEAAAHVAKRVLSNFDPKENWVLTEAGLLRLSQSIVGKLTSVVTKITTAEVRGNVPRMPEAFRTAADANVRTQVIERQASRSKGGTRK